MGAYGIIFMLQPIESQARASLGRVVLQERDGLRVLVDLTKQVSSEAIKVLEEVLAELKRRSKQSG